MATTCSPEAKINADKMTRKYILLQFSSLTQLASNAGTGVNTLVTVGTVRSSESLKFPLESPTLSHGDGFGGLCKVQRGQNKAAAATQA